MLDNDEIIRKIKLNNVVSNYPLLIPNECDKLKTVFNELRQAGFKLEITRSLVFNSRKFGFNHCQQIKVNKINSFSHYLINHFNQYIADVTVYLYQIKRTTDGYVFLYAALF